MARLLVRSGDMACVWSTVVDAPVTNFLPLQRLVERHPQYEIIDVSGVLGETTNRAGPHESSVLTEADLLKLYEDDGSDD